MKYIRSLFFVFALSLFVLPSAQAQVEAYELVGGNYLPEVIEAKNQGQFLRVRPVATKDTLWMWIQHSTRVDPQYESADHADVVVWCWPKEYPHSNHVMPEAEKIAVRSIGKGDNPIDGKFLVVVDLSKVKSAKERHITPELISLMRSRVNH